MLTILPICLYILNGNGQTKINSSNIHLSAIDLAYSTPIIAYRLNWQVFPEMYSSDHLLIIIPNISNIYTRNSQYI